MRVFVTGAAGFIGMHVAERLANAGHTVAGLDNFNAYYDPAIKRTRAAYIAAACPIEDIDIADADRVKEAITAFAPDVVVHLAAQAGVRYSLVNPFAYVRSNLDGHVAVLEACRTLGGKLSHMIYASSSSVYGGNAKIPFSETDQLSDPVSFYAATKRSGELMSSTYAHLYNVRQIGLRFFTVYGPWGRPDMAYWLWTQSILEGRPIRVFNRGDMRRDFTYIDDVIQGVVSIVEHSPVFIGDRPHRIYNIGNNRPVALGEMIAVLEAATGKKAIIEMTEMQPGDVKETYADIEAIQRDYGYRPSTNIEEGLPRFVAWYRDHIEQRPSSAD